MNVGRVAARWPLLLAAAIAGAPAAAADKPLWEAGIGVAALRLPHYRGADQSRNWLLPVPYLVYRGEIFKADREGARALLVDTERLELDFSVAASAPTDSEDDTARRGMEDLAPTVEFGPNLSWTAARGAGWKLDLRLPVRAVFTVEASPRWIGYSAAPNVNLDSTAVVPGWNLGLQAGPLFGTRKLHGVTYDVPADQAIPGRPAYQAPGGYAGAQFTAAMSRRFERTWVGLFVRYDVLDGAAFAPSPLVRDRRQLGFGIAFSWVLATSSTRVSAED